ncbi:allophanate hydrolase [Acidithiobacillus ferrianus]|uniref:allophanate hydrolase n=1 Tax=Acidithiobacillus ferrianus TaxID=2678518 RepID=UPI0034E4DDBE
MDANLDKISFDVHTLSALYASGRCSPVDIVNQLYARILNNDNNIWIFLRSQEDVMADVEIITSKVTKSLPLFGVPFAVKDNIDVAGIPTTAGCKDYEYIPSVSSPTVSRLIEAGAIFIGKTNMDQFATGLNGTRSPFGICHNSFDKKYIAGGSSSGSAVAVASGLVSFSLGTDTGGSGRIPAAFNNIVGFKPSKGLLSTTGLVPACRSIDCISIFALTVRDAYEIFCLINEFDNEDCFARRDRKQVIKSSSSFTFGMPFLGQIDFFGDTNSSVLFKAAESLLKKIGGTPISIDMSPFFEVQKLLYDGPWLAERYGAIKNVLTGHPDSVNPIIRSIVSAGADIKADSCFTAFYNLKTQIRKSEEVWNKVDMLLLPTAATIFSIDDILHDPIYNNSILGRYTGFVNLMDLSAISLPMGFRQDGLPLGISLIAPALHESFLSIIGHSYQLVMGGNLGATGCSLPKFLPQPLYDS